MLGVVVEAVVGRRSDDDWEANGEEGKEAERDEGEEWKSKRSEGLEEI